MYRQKRVTASDAVNSYLAAHNLPATDAHIIYDLGRADLRNAIRGNIITTLLGIIATAILSGAPPVGTLGTFNFELVPQANTRSD